MKEYVGIIKTSFFLAFKSLSRDKKIALLTLLIISIGFVSAVTLPGILKDFSENTAQMYIDTRYGHITIEPLEGSEKIENVDLIKKKIKSLPQVEGIVAIQKTAGTIYDNKEGNVAGEVWITDPEDLAEVTVFDDILFEGDYLNKKSLDGFYSGCVNIKFCTLNEGEDNIDADIGENLRIVFGTGEEAVLKLKGTYRHTMYTLEQLVIINEKTAKEIFENYDKNKADIILIRLSDTDLTKATIADISSFNIGGEIISHKVKVKAQIKMVEDFNLIGFISFLIGVIISIITIYIILYINVLNKGVQIGIIRAIGISSQTIIISYIFQSIFYGLGGSIFGFGLALLVKTYFDFYPIITVHGPITAGISAGYYAATFITMIITASITGYIVSYKETQRNIMEAIFNRN
ncbi:MAG: ABC transporter permease [Candidatus Nanoarchaeia archaeon]